MTDPTPAQRIGLGIAHDLGVDWLRADALDRLEIAYGWLQAEGSPIAVANYLRETLAVLESDPTQYLRDRLRKIEDDARARLRCAA